MSSVQSWLRRQSKPVTIALIAAIVAGHLATWITVDLVKRLFVFSGSLMKFWSVVTYPFVGMPDPITLVFLGLWLFSIGGMIEATHGTRNYILLWIAFSILSIIPLSLVTRSAAGPLLPVTALTVMWATRHPNEQVRLMMVIPIQAKWIGWISVAIVFFNYAYIGSQFLAGLLACIGSGLAYLYASNKIPGLAYGLGYGRYTKPKKTKAQKEREDAYYSDVFLREKDREERERLRKLFESSIDDDGKN